MIEFRSLSKSFSGVGVLHEVSFAVPAGRTLGLVGENGAGKSTLMNLLGGNLRPDSGEMRLDGRTYAPGSPLDAARQGIAFVHQELNLFPNLSIGENLFLTAFPRVAGLPWIDRRGVRDRARALLEQVGLPHSPETEVEQLPAGERQLVEIAKALSFEPRLLILDEPTTSLSARETERLFALMARLRQRGLAMIYISHSLGDVLRLCDDLVVLRDGAVVGTGPRADFTAERLISLMVGRSVSQLYPARKPPEAGCANPPSPVALEARRLSQPGTVRDVSFTLHRHEVLGIAGLMGAGRSELARILFGLDPCREGEVWVDGKPAHHSGPRQRIERGVAFLTENRREEGLCLQASIADNVALVALGQYARTLLALLDLSGLRQAVRSIRAAVRLTAAASDEAPAASLSGGNQQKVVLAKWLLAKPRVLILDEPTRGIDVGARFEIYQLILQLADEGAGVLVISSELEELMGLCDRILVMSRGRIRDQLRREEFDRERILAAALWDGVNANSAPSAAEVGAFGRRLT